MARRWALLGLILGVFGFQYFFQPYSLYPGDANAIRIESRFFIKHLEIGIPTDQKNLIDPLFFPPISYENQYLWENKNSKKFFSKWGPANTLLYAIPLAFADPKVPMSAIYALNFLNAVLTAFLAAGLFVVASQFGLKPLYAGLQTVVIIYGTYLFFYTRAQTVEIFHLALLIWGLAFFQKTSRSFESLLAQNRRWILRRDYWIGALILAVLIHAKIYFIVFAGFFYLALWWGRFHSRPGFLGVVVSGVILTVFSASLMAVNYLKFGSVWQTGLGPAAPMIPNDWYSLSHFALSIPGYLWKPRYAIASHMLPAVLAFFATPWVWKRFPREVFLAVGFFLMTVLIAGGWKNFAGEWCYGPRWLIQPLVVLASVGCAGAVAMVCDQCGKKSRITFGLVLPLLILAYGGRREFYRNYFDFYADKQMEAALLALPGTESVVLRWQEASSVTVLQSLYDLCSKREGQLLRDFDQYLLALSDERRKKIIRFVLGYCPSNYRFF